VVVRDIMTWNVVTVTSDTPIMEARKVMEAHKVLRLPVVDKGKLVGMVTKERITRTGPSPATSLSVWEINYLLAKMTVREIMAKDLVTVTPDTTVESAVALAQTKGVGALPVVEDGKLVGIVTTNDFFYKIFNPMLGINRPGTRVVVHSAANPKGFQDVGESMKKQGAKLIAIHQGPPIDDQEKDLLVQLDTSDASVFLKELAAKGYRTELEER
jgi:acetoin utilization protein AcuB